MRVRDSVVYRWMVLWRKRGPHPEAHLHDPWRHQFVTHKECLNHIHATFGYVRDRRDLRVAPHYWRMPIPVRVRLTASVLPKLSRSVWRAGPSTDEARRTRTGRIRALFRPISQA